MRLVLPAHKGLQDPPALRVYKVVLVLPVPLVLLVLKVTSGQLAQQVLRVFRGLLDLQVPLV